MLVNLAAPVMLLKLSCVPDPAVVYPLKKPLNTFRLTGVPTAVCGLAVTPPPLQPHTKNTANKQAASLNVFISTSGVDEIVVIYHPSGEMQPGGEKNIHQKGLPPKPKTFFQPFRCSKKGGWHYIQDAPIHGEIFFCWIKQVLKKGRTIRGASFSGHVSGYCTAASLDPLLSAFCWLQFRDKGGQGNEKTLHPTLAAHSCLRTRPTGTAAVYGGCCGHGRAAGNMVQQTDPIAACRGSGHPHPGLRQTVRRRYPTVQRGSALLHLTRRIARRFAPPRRHKELRSGRQLPRVPVHNRQELFPGLCLAARDVPL